MLQLFESVGETIIELTIQKEVSSSAPLLWRCWVAKVSSGGREIGPGQGRWNISVEQDHQKAAPRTFVLDQEFSGSWTVLSLSSRNIKIWL